MWRSCRGVAQQSSGKFLFKWIPDSSYAARPASQLGCQLRAMWSWRSFFLPFILPSSFFLLDWTVASVFLCHGACCGRLLLFNCLPNAALGPRSSSCSVPAQSGRGFSVKLCCLLVKLQGIVVKLIGGWAVESSLHP